MNKSLYLTIIIFCIAIPSSFYMGKQAGRKEFYNELLIVQALTIETQKDFKMSLENQRDYIKSLKNAFGKTLEEKKGRQDWIEEITTQ